MWYGEEPEIEWGPTAIGASDESNGRSVSHGVEGLPDRVMFVFVFAKRHLNRLVDGVAM